jgi:hypothetical protein
MEVAQYVAVDFYGLKSNITSHYLQYQKSEDNRFIS